MFLCNFPWIHLETLIIAKTVIKQTFELVSFQKNQRLLLLQIFNRNTAP